MKNGKNIKKFLKNNYTGWLFCTPLIIGLAAFTFYPIVQSLIYSFHKFDGVRVYEPVLFDNFARMFARDRDRAEFSRS